MKLAEKGRKNFLTQIPFILDPVKKIQKKIAKKIQNYKKPLSGIIFCQHGMRFAEKERKKFYTRLPFILDPGKKISKKIPKKNQKIKNKLPALFLAKMG